VCSTLRKAVATLIPRVPGAPNESSMSSPGRGTAAERGSVGVCGEAAASPTLAPVLVGLEAEPVHARSALADVRVALAAVTLAECRELARDALAGRGA
jgi:phosphotransferase system enzyme I (PtsI)